MKSVRLQNLRCLRDTGTIALKPLTVLVGRNSSGKSTFLRFFPLMKQTIEAGSREPVLWYSPRYVDYGSFQESLSFGSRTGLMAFEFGLDLRILDTRLRGRWQFLRELGQSEEVPWQISWTFPRAETPRRQSRCIVKTTISGEQFRGVSLRVDGHVVNWDIADEGIVTLSLNGQKFENFRTLTESSQAPGYLPQIVSSDGKSCADYFIGQLLGILRKVSHKGTKPRTLLQFALRIPFGRASMMLSQMKTRELTAKKLKEKIEGLALEDPIAADLINLTVGSYVDVMISSINQYLSSYFASVRYIAPVRASAERYYRLQGLPIDEIDPRGENLAMALHYMNPAEVARFDEWVQEHFQFRIDSRVSGGHTYMGISTDRETSVNLADSGFGYSQLLPIILSMWRSVYSDTTRRMNRGPRESKVITFAIEQPELHLHPALQGLLIDAFVSLVMDREHRDVRMIIETHSETILNRIGYLISKRVSNLRPKDVSVLIFDGTSDGAVVVRKSGYDDQGYLRSWPLGFFTPAGVDRGN